MRPIEESQTIATINIITKKTKKIILKIVSNRKRKIMESR
jgi:hypothetical protein